MSDDTKEHRQLALAYGGISEACAANLCDAIDQLQEALEPFADIDGEGDEDFSDDTPVTVCFGRTTHYSLKLGDFRRARRIYESSNPTS